MHVTTPSPAPPPHRRRLVLAAAIALLASGCAALAPPGATPAAAARRPTRVVVVDPVLDGEDDDGEGAARRGAIRAIGWRTPEAAAGFVAQLTRGEDPDDADGRDDEASPYGSDLGAPIAESAARAIRRYRALSVTDDPGTADAIVTPSVSFFREADARVGMLVRLSVDRRRPDATDTGYREYWYTAPHRLPEDGPGSWLATGALAYRQSLRAALSRLAAVLARDASGNLGARGTRAITWRERESGRRMRSLLLHETPAYLVVSPIVRGRAMRDVVSIVDRRRMLRAEAPGNAASASRPGVAGTPALAGVDSAP